MSDFPQAHTTHTTTTTTTTVTGGRVHLDVSYIKTIPGILRIVEIVLCIILFICAVSACSAGWSLGECGWGSFVGFMGFILVIAWLLFNLFHIHEMAANVPWLLIELIFYAIWTFFLLVAGIALAVLSARWSNVYGWGAKVSSGAGAASFFAFAAAVVFGFHTFLIFRDWRSHSVAARGPIQGHP